MKRNRASALLAALIVVCGAVLAFAADRVRTGQWETTVTFPNGMEPRKSSNCVSEADAAAMNGDVASIRAVLVKDLGESGCTVKDIAIKGNQVVVTSVCMSRESTSTTTYHGDAFETVTTNGTKIQAKRVGACK